MRFIIVLGLMLNVNILYSQNLSIQISEESSFKISNRTDEYSYMAYDDKFTFKSDNIVFGQLSYSGFNKILHSDKLLSSSKHFFDRGSLYSSLDSSVFGFSFSYDNITLFHTRLDDQFEFGVNYLYESNDHFDLNLILSRVDALEKLTNDSYYTNINFISYEYAYKAMISTIFDFDYFKFQNNLVGSITNNFEDGFKLSSNIYFSDILIDFNFLVSYFSDNYIVDIDKLSTYIYYISSTLAFKPLDQLKIGLTIFAGTPRFNELSNFYPIKLENDIFILYNDKKIKFSIYDDINFERSSSGELQLENRFKVLLSQKIILDKSIKYIWEIGNRVYSSELDFDYNIFTFSNGLQLKRVSFYCSYEYNTKNEHRLSYKLTCPFSYARISIRNDVVFKPNDQSCNLKLVLNL